jgi:hypothetical protein
MWIWLNFFFSHMNLSWAGENDESEEVLCSSEHRSRLATVHV